jgi:hypothetical protein
MTFGECLELMRSSRRNQEVYGGYTNGNRFRQERNERNDDVYGWERPMVDMPYPRPMQGHHVDYIGELDALADEVLADFNTNTYTDGPQYQRDSYWHGESEQWHPPSYPQPSFYETYDYSEDPYSTLPPQQSPRQDGMDDIRAMLLQIVDQTNELREGLKSIRADVNVLRADRESINADLNVLKNKVQQLAIQPNGSQQELATPSLLIQPCENETKTWEVATPLSSKESEQQEEVRVEEAGETTCVPPHDRESGSESKEVVEEEGEEDHDTASLESNGSSCESLHATPSEQMDFIFPSNAFYGHPTHGGLENEGMRLQSNIVSITIALGIGFNQPFKRTAYTHTNPNSIASGIFNRRGTPGRKRKHRCIKTGALKQPAIRAK